MSDESIMLLINDTEYTGWTEVSIRTSVTALCHSFSFTMVDVWRLNGAIVAIQPGDAVTIFIGSDAVVQGHVDSVELALSAGDHSIRVAGRSTTADLVDCSAMNKPGIWRNRTLAQIVTDLVKPFFLVEVVDEAKNMTKFTEFKLNTGETVFDAMSRAALKRAVLLLTNSAGHLVLTNSGSRRTTDGLKEGSNVLSASASFNYSDRFTEYTVRGQQITKGTGWDKSTISIDGMATDTALLERPRPLLIKAEGAITRNDAQNQARWEANIRAGKSQTVRVQVRGYHQSSGELWTINQLANVDIPSLLVANSLLITSVEYVKSGSGSVTNLELMPPNAFAAKPKQAVEPLDDFGWGKGSRSNQPDEVEQ